MGKKRIKRGFPVALLIGFNDSQASFWQIYSEQVRPIGSINRGRKRKNQDKKQLYAFFEELVNFLRPIIKEGIKSILLVSPPKTDYIQEFRDHISQHHKWLIQKSVNSVTFGEFEGNASTLEDIVYLVENTLFREIKENTVEEEGDKLLNELERRINQLSEKDSISYSLKEIESLIGVDKKSIKIPLPDIKKPEYIVITDKYLDESSQKGRINRLLQIAQNKKIRTRTIFNESSLGQRIEQLGGLVCFLAENN